MKKQKNKLYKQYVLDILNNKYCFFSYYLIFIKTNQ